MDLSKIVNIVSKGSDELITGIVRHLADDAMARIWKAVSGGPKPSQEDIAAFTAALAKAKHDLGGGV